MTIGFNADPYEKDKNFYRDNIGKSVNLFGERKTISGELIGFNEEERTAILRNVIDRGYDSNGSSYFFEDPSARIVKIDLFPEMAITTREDRVGRIKSYNKELKDVELGRTQNRKLAK